jgi:hypothetical protein
LPNGISIAWYCLNTIFSGRVGGIELTFRFGLKGENKMKAPERDLVKPSFWQLVFMQSKVNGAAYHGKQLPRRNWNWPKDTYLQQRLRLAKWYQAPDKGWLN